MHSFRGSRVWKNFLLVLTVQSDSGAHPASSPMGIGVLSQGVKRPGRDAVHSPPSGAMVKNVWGHASTPPIRLHGVVLN
jgi:hypothetical protein